MLGQAVVPPVRLCLACVMRLRRCVGPRGFSLRSVYARGACGGQLSTVAAAVTGAVAPTTAAAHAAKAGTPDSRNEAAAPPVEQGHSSTPHQRSSSRSNCSNNSDCR